MKEISGADFMPIDGPMAPILSIVNGFSCVFGSLGNIALIMVILVHKQLHGASELLLMSLALADFLSCAVYLPLLLMRINTNEKLPTVMNQSRRAIGQAVVVCGSLNLLMLTVDRLVFFYRPLRYTHWMRKKIILTIIIIIYGISLFVGFYAYFDMIKSQYPKIALVGVPMLIFFLLHYAICRLAQAHRNQVANQEQSLQHNYNINSGAMVQARRNVRTVMLFGILYLLTWLPVTVFQLWRSVTNHHDPKSFQKYFYLLLTIQQISACIDPYLCCYRNNKVKAVLKKLVRIQKHLKVGGLGNSGCTMTSMSLSDGLDKGNRNLAGKATVVSQSLENILEAKVLSNTNSGDNLDMIISISSSLERASPNEYESFQSIYRSKSLGRTIGYSEDNLDKIISICSMERASPNEYESFANIDKIRSSSIDSNVNIEQSTTEQPTLSEGNEECVGNTNNVEISDISCEENPSLNVSESLESDQTTQAEQTVGNNDSVHSNSDTNTDVSTDIIKEQSALSEYERLQNMNNDTAQKDRVENVEEIHSSTSDKVLLNLSKTKELSDMEQSEETQLLEQPLEQSLGLEQPLEQPFEQSLGLEQTLEQSLGLEKSLEQSVIALEKSSESQMSDDEKNSSLADKTYNDQSVVLNIPRSVDESENTTKL